MTPEIKFRGWNEHRKEWFYGYFYALGKESFILMPGLPEQRIEVVPKSVGQFTGFTDVHGLYIYDGHIVVPHRINCRGGKYKAHNRTRAVMWVVAESNRGYPRTGWNLTASPYEIIGNVFENPDLLPPNE